mgnify:FL=1
MLNLDFDIEVFILDAKRLANFQNEIFLLAKKQKELAELSGEIPSIQKELHKIMNIEFITVRDIFHSRAENVSIMDAVFWRSVVAYFLSWDKKPLGYTLYSDLENQIKDVLTRQKKNGRNRAFNTSLTTEIERHIKTTKQIGEEEVSERNRQKKMQDKSIYVKSGTRKAVDDIIAKNASLLFRDKNYGSMAEMKRIITKSLYNNEIPLPPNNQIPNEECLHRWIKEYIKNNREDKEIPLAAIPL